MTARATTLSPETSIEAIAKELSELHTGVATWIGGRCPDSEEELDRLVRCRLDDAFRLVAPGGHRITREMMLTTMKGLHGTNPEFHMKITDVQVITQNDELVIADCLQWQRNARQSTPANNGRCISAAFARDETRPNGLRWLYAHETWLPEEEMARGNYDF